MGDPATPEKALFDTIYIRAARREQVYLPELELPGQFNPAELESWALRIRAGWLRTIVRRESDRALQHAS